MDLLSSISHSLDPGLNAARDEDRSAQTIQTTQILSLLNQLHDTQATANDLCNCLLQSDRDHNDAECHADCAELQLEMARMTRGQYASCSPLQDHCHH
jgi:hypothetical protein